MWSLVVLSLLTADADVDAGLPPQKLYAKPLARKVDEARVERVLASLSTRERAAQLLMAYPQIGKSSPVEVGGILFVGNALKNITKANRVGLSQTSMMTATPCVLCSSTRWRNCSSRCSARPTARRSSC